jgi:Spy/CpxP family protein refolding chaperone
MKKLILLILVFGLALSNIDAQHPEMRRKQIQRHDMLIKLLKLSDEQAQKFSDLRLETEKRNIDLRSEIQKNRLELRKLMSAKELDSKKILELTNRNSELQAKIKEAHVKNLIEMNKLLTDEQKEIFANHRARMKDGPDDNCCDMPKREMKRHPRF